MIRGGSAAYLGTETDTRGVVETVIENMGKRFGYSDELAMETVLYALQKKIQDFKELIN